MRKIRVLVIDDSAFMRKIIKDMLSYSDKIEVVGIGKNGLEAIELNKELQPDVITLDIEMPIMNGVDALKQIVKDRKVHVIMFSSLTKKDTDITMETLQQGAYDFITKPSSILKVNTDDIRIELISKVESTEKSNLSNIFAKSSINTNRRREPKTTSRMGTKSTNGNIKKIIAIGTSTGGPKALQEVMPYIPANIEGPVLIVQHMPPGFTKSLAERLNNMSDIRIKEAEDGDILKNGCGYLAPGDRHLKIEKNGENYIISLDDGEKVSGHKPSVDAMFHSLAKLSIPKVGVIMTGMGSDGAEGLKEIRNKGGYVIGQDESTCIVYGMPKAAEKLNAINKVVELTKISQEIVKAMEV